MSSNSSSALTWDDGGQGELKSSPHWRTGQVGNRNGSRRVDNGTSGLSHRERLVLSLQLRGMKQVHIAKLLGMNEQALCVLTGKPRYCAAFDAALDKVDTEFARLKPKALRALEAGLDSEDENTGLRAADLWFKSMGYKGYGEAAQSGPRMTAEDIAAALLAAGGGTVTIDVSPAGEARPEPPEGRGVVLDPGTGDQSKIANGDKCGQDG